MLLALHRLGCPNSFQVVEKATMSSANADAKKRCENCLEHVKIYITCFECNAAYHIYCWKKVPGAFVNTRGQLFCCSSLTSNYATINTNLGTQDNLPEELIEEGNVDGYKQDLENCPIKQEDSEWIEFKCDACHLEFTNKGLENHSSECPNKEGEFIQELKEDKDLDSCLHKQEDLECSEFRCGACLLEFTNKEHLKNHYSGCSSKEGEFMQELKEDKAGLFCSFCNEEHYQNESSEQHIKRCHVGSSYSRLNKNNSICINNTKRNSVQVDDKEKKCTLYNYSTHISVAKRVHIHTNEKLFKCNICDFATTWKRVLKRHILVKHSNVDKEYKCKDCEYSTHIKHHLKRHIHTHTCERPFKCNMCDYAAVQGGTLNRHVLAKHSNAAKKYKCKDLKNFKLSNLLPTK